MITMSNLLILAKDMQNSADLFAEYFDQVNLKSLADIIIDAQSGGEPNVLVEGEDLENWDAVYVEPDPRVFNYTRVLMEIIATKDINCNLDQSSTFILAKKPYLFKVLAERGVNMPRQVSLSTEKGMTGLNNNLDFPVIAKKYSSFKLSEVKQFEEFDQLKSFAELSEHGEGFIMIQEYEEEKEEDIFELLYIDGQIISLKLEGSVYDKTGEISTTYHNISDGQREVVNKAVDSIGTQICRIRLHGSKVADIDLDPQLERFKQKSGKNVYGRISEYLKSDDK